MHQTSVFVANEQGLLSITGTALESGFTMSAHNPTESFWRGRDDSREMGIEYSLYTSLLYLLGRYVPEFQKSKIATVRILDPTE
jgi:hypothetical protein